MKIKFLVTIALIASLNVAAMINVSAQSITAVRVRIGFDFQVKDKVFPAGEYYLETVRFGMRDALSIKGSGKNKSSMIILTDQLYAGKIQKRKIIFTRHGEKSVLTSAFLDHGRWGLSIPVTGKRKQELSAAASTLVVELSF
jgi:hypothetical protein